ncbi:hypothetical protein KAR91_06110 [Candidatus Pacearchaeota archaeon]|nr:hypothetical protein [Candidatus Pacearchaeota archaeon]
MHQRRLRERTPKIKVMYKTIRLTILSLFIASLSHAQDVISPNEIDSLGLKQGLWVELEAKPDIIGVAHLDLDDGTSEDRMKYDYDNPYILKYKGYYENGFRTGEWKVYSPNGVIRYIITFKNGVIYGDFKLYHPNGKIKLQGYIDRKPMTTVSYYDEEGTFIKQADWFTNGLIERLNR